MVLFWLQASLQAADKSFPGLEKLVFLHYPPVYPGAAFEDMVQALYAGGIRRCFYGHLHGYAARRAAQGAQDGVAYRLISADALEFKPLYIPL